jgi:hypothetical protein
VRGINVTDTDGIAGVPIFNPNAPEGRQAVNLHAVLRDDGQIELSAATPDGAWAYDDVIKLKPTMPPRSVKSQDPEPGPDFGWKGDSSRTG